MTIALLILGLVVLVAAVLIFNRLVALGNRAEAAWADIDVQLKRRHDLVDNLVETVKGYARHERETLEKVVQARARAEGARNRGRPGEIGEQETRLGGRIRALFALVEAYPVLEAGNRFLDLQRALTDVEDHIQHARRYYNAVVRDLNTRIQSFPDMLIARPLRFRGREFFELDSPAEAGVPRFDLEGEP